MRTTIQLIATVALLAAPPAAGQDRSMGGPPPEIRTLVDAVTTSVLGDSPDAWEAMAKERFAPELLASMPVADRRHLYDKLHKAFAGGKRGPVLREGPDAPLQLQMVGPSGPLGTIVLDLTSGMPPRITRVTVETGSKEKPADPGGPPSPSISASMAKADLARALDDYLRRLSDDGRFSGAALVAHDGEVWFEKAYGFANRGDRVASAVDTRFNIGSINKAFTRLAIEQLVAQQKLSLTDTLGALIPDYPQAVSRTATIDQLLRHTAGISDFFGPAFNEAAKDRFRSNEDYFRFVSQLPPTFAPGARNQYCNGCYIVLGAIVERISNMPYERYVTDQIFAPAGMTQTGFLQIDALEPRVATGYTTRGGGSGTLRSNVLMHGAAGSGAGGSYSTVRDLLAFVTARKDGRLPGGGMTRIAGGAPGTNATLQSEGVWTVVVLTNLDPPFGEDTGGAIMNALAPGR